MITLSDVTNWVKQVQNQSKGIILSLILGLIGGGWLGYRARVLFDDNWTTVIAIVLGFCFTFLVCALIRKIKIDVDEAVNHERDSRLNSQELELLKYFGCQFDHFDFFEVNTDHSATICDELVRKKILTRVYPDMDRFRIRDWKAAEKVKAALKNETKNQGPTG